jgi:hypothetical protein
MEDCLKPLKISEKWWMSGERVGGYDVNEFGSFRWTVGKNEGRVCILKSQVNTFVYTGFWKFEEPNPPGVL